MDRMGEIIDEQRGRPGTLLPALLKVQSLYGYLPQNALEDLAEGLGVPLAEVIGTASFYSFLTTTRRGRYVIRICKSPPCHLRAAGATLMAFKDALGIGEGGTTPNGKFSLETCGCLGICDRAPAVMVNDEAFGPILAGDVREFLSKFE